MAKLTEPGVLTAESIAVLRSSVATIVESAIADGSRGWLAAMRTAAAYELGGDPDALIATSYRGGGELSAGRLTGCWASVVGAACADFFLLPVGDGRRVLLPRAGVRVEVDDGRSGLAAAGIGGVTASGAAGGCVLEDVAPRVAVIAGAAMAAAVVGSAEGLWCEHVEQVRARLTTSHGGEEVSDEASAQVSWAASDIAAARLQVLASLNSADARAAGRAHRPAAARARGAADRVLRSSRHALDASDSVTGRWRDVQAGCRLAVHQLDGLGGNST